MIRIRNWQKWQSYRSDRGQPPWIKVHRRLAQDPSWVQLTDAQRGQLVCMWILAADRDGELTSDRRLLARMCFLDSEPDLEVFARLGFIELDASVTSPRRQHDRPEAEAEAEEVQRQRQISSSSAREKIEEWEHGMRARFLGVGGGTPTNPVLEKHTDDPTERERIFADAVLTVKAESNGSRPSAAFFDSIVRRLVRKPETSRGQTMAEFLNGDG